MNDSIRVNPAIQLAAGGYEKDLILEQPELFVFYCSLAGATGAITTSPLEFLKTRLQVTARHRVLCAYTFL